MTVQISTKISIKQRNEKGEWTPVSGIVGLSIREIFTKMHGTETVCECKRGDKTWYFCGTDKWKKNMKKRGTSCQFNEAITLLESICPDFLDEIPEVSRFDKIFPGIQISVFQTGTEKGE